MQRIKDIIHEWKNEGSDDLRNYMSPIHYLPDRPEKESDSDKKDCIYPEISVGK